MVTTIYKFECQERADMIILDVGIPRRKEGLVAFPLDRVGANVRRCRNECLQLECGYATTTGRHERSRLGRVCLPEVWGVL